MYERKTTMHDEASPEPNPLEKRLPKEQSNVNRPKP
jgi:hypothetical protein